MRRPLGGCYQGEAEAEEVEAGPLSRRGRISRLGLCMDSSLRSSTFIQVNATASVMVVALGA